jgi:dTMP kinase
MEGIQDINIARLIVKCGGMTGLFVCIEGIDGAGKHTQVELLQKSLGELGTKVSLYSYPDYDSLYGKMLRNFLDGKVNISVAEQVMLYLLDMVADLKKIKAELDAGNVVISDRYFLSTIAYQSAGGVDSDKVKGIIDLIELPKPDIVFYIDVPVEESVARKMRQKGKTDKFESAKEYLGKVRTAYEKLNAEKYGAGKWIKINGTNDIIKIHEQINKEVTTKLES